MKRHTHFTQRGAHYFSVLLFILSISFLNHSCKKINLKEANSRYHTGENEKSGISPSNLTNLPVIQACGTPEVSNLIAGQFIDIGSVSIYNTADSLYIDLAATGNWWLQSASVYVGILANMPQAPNGNPKVGQFPYQQSYSPQKKNTRFAIPLADLPSCFIVAVHAEARKIVNGQLVQSETAWGQGVNLPGPSWAMGIEFCPQVCVNCEYSVFTTTLKAEGKLICGQVMVTNDEDSVYVTYKMMQGWKLRKIQLYIGSYGSMPSDISGNPSFNSFPKIKVFNVAIEGSVTVGYSLDDLPSNYVIAAHGETERSIDGVQVLVESAWGFGTPFVGTSVWGWTIPYTTQVCL